MTKAKNKNSNRTIRVYRVEQSMNADKLDRILDVLRVYRKTAKSISGLQWKLFFQNGSFYRNESINNGIVESQLSERWKQTCQYQVVSTLDSYIENCKNRFRDIVVRSSVDEQIKLYLFYINKYGLWYKEGIKIPLFVDNKRVKGEYVDIPQDIIKLSRRIIKHIFKEGRKPSFKNINMVLDSKIAKIILKEMNEASRFDYWIRFSTLNKNSPVFIPVLSNKYFDAVDGKLLNSCQFNFDEENNLSIYFTKEISKPVYSSDVDKIGIDVGLNTLIATNFGDLFGRTLYAKLKHYDTRLMELSAKQQKQNRSVDTKQHRRIVKTIRSIIKNEIGRIINRMIDLYHPKEIVIEKLNFKNSRLSRQTNRILRNFGKSVLTRKLESVKELLGIKITEVNPAYTSQECRVCGYVDERNRKGDRFKCLMCSHEGNADVDGSVTVLDRSSDEEISVNQGTYKVFDVLVRRFCQALSNGSSYASIVRAMEVLKGNKYMNVYMKHLQFCPEGFL